MHPNDARGAQSTTPCRDVIGIGFGPANLSVALALLEDGGLAGGVDATFLERQPAFGWHRGMLIERGRMQIAFLKDLATQRNPRSRFSFVNYLHEHERLNDFINLQTFCPTRREFHAYLSWCAGAVEPLVQYGHDVKSVAPVFDADGSVICWEIVAERTGATPGRSIQRAKSLIFSPGLAPRLPDGVTAGDRVWHSAELLPRLDGFKPRPGARFVVVGGGQSAAESVAHIHERFRDAEIVAVLPKYGYTPADDSAFVNGMFDPGEVEAFHGAEPEAREYLLRSHANTNYGVVDPELITDLYGRWYGELVAGDRRLSFMRSTRLVEARTSEGGLRLTLRAVGEKASTELDADCLVCATGYRAVLLDAMIGDDVWSLIEHDEAGQIQITRDYQVVMAPHVKAAIFVQGDERTHGLGATLLSNLAVRAGKIVAAIDEQRDLRPPVASESRVAPNAFALGPR